MRKTVFKVCFILFVCLSIFLGFANASHAAGPDLSLYPSTGYAVLNKDFSVDIMLDTGGEDTTTTHAVFRFDPDKLQVIKAQHGDLYCQYPEDEYTVDNTGGWIMLTGFCLDPYYNSGSSPGLFGRITFRPQVEGIVTMNFEFNGDDEEWKSIVKDNGSPPQCILTDTPTGGTYTVVSSVPDSSAGTSGKLPGVGIFDNNFAVWGLVLVSLSGSVLLIDWGLTILKSQSKTHDERTVIIGKNDVK